MNAKKAKQLRKIARLSKYSDDTLYHLPKKNRTVALANCKRKVYKEMKQALKGTH